MGKFVIKRILNSLILILFVSFLGFLAISLLPGTPEEAKLGEKAYYQKEDKPNPFLSFWNFLCKFPMEGFGVSLTTGRKVIDEIVEALPYSIYLSLSSIFLSIIISIPIGAFCALHRGKLIDTTAIIISVLLNSFPIISLGPFLIFIFSVYFGVLPVSGSENFSSLILPSLTLSIPFSAFLVRIIRKSLIEEIRKGYILSLKARGIPFSRIIFYHALRNSLFPFFTAITLRLGNLISGAILTESLFSWPGIGRLLFRSVSGRDYNLAFGIILLSSLSYVLLNLVTDIFYFILDPRVRYKS